VPTDNYVNSITTFFQRDEKEQKVYNHLISHIKLFSFRQHTQKWRRTPVHLLQLAQLQATWSTPFLNACAWHGHKDHQRLHL